MNNEVFKGRDVLTLADLSPEECARVLDVAAAQKRAWATGNRQAPLAHKTVAVILQKPSMRTRVSFEVAITRLGAHPVIMTGQDGAFSRGESIHDTAKVLERYVDAIVLRTFAHRIVEEVAQYARIPVINALTDDHHPCQGLADLLTIRERLGRLEGVRIAYVGDGNNMAHTYAHAAALVGAHLTIASPVGYLPQAAVIEQASAIAQSTGATIAVVSDPDSAVTDADVVITDTWASMGQESEHAQRAAAFASYRVDSHLFASASPEAIFMHCLPAHRGEEVTDEVMDHPRSVIFDEAENRLHVQKALLSLVVA